MRQSHMDEARKIHKLFVQRAVKSLTTTADNQRGTQSNPITSFPICCPDIVEVN